MIPDESVPAIVVAARNVIVEVIIKETDAEDRWKEDFLQSLIMFKETGVKIRVADSEDDITDCLIANFIKDLEKTNIEGVK